jgi:hypothetical protein
MSISRKAKISFRENTKTKIFVSTLPGGLLLDYCTLSPMLLLLLLLLLMCVGFGKDEAGR